MWNLELADQAGATIADAGTGQQRVFTFTRNTPAQVQIGFDVETDAAARLTDTLLNGGIPRLRGWRDGTLRFHESWAPMSEDATVDQVQLAACTFQGADGILVQRYVDPPFVTLFGGTVTFTQVDAGQIWWSLIDTTNQDSPTGIGQGSIEATMLRDRTYDLGKQLLEAGQELTGVIDGFDYEIAPVWDPATPDVLGELNVYASQGSDRTTDVLFEYGPQTLGNVQTFGRQWQLPVNRAFVLGANGLVGVAEDTASQDKYGLYVGQDQQLDVSEQATLDAKAQAMLRPDPVRVVSFTPSPTAVPQPWDDYWLGDTVTVRARSGSITEDVAVRLNQIVVTLDEEDNESVTLAIEGAI